MNLCPWCGAPYDLGQENCQKCGGRIANTTTQKPAKEDAGIGTGLLQLPPVPRRIAGNYARRLLVTDTWAIVAGIGVIIGAALLLLAAVLALVVTTAVLPLFFAAIGLLLAGAGALVLAWRWQRAEKIVEVLRTGKAVEGEIVQTREVTTVRVNRRHPWAIDYEFRIDGQVYTGQVRTLNAPGAAHQKGRPILVLYLPYSPEWNALYPHP